MYRVCYQELLCVCVCVCVCVNRLCSRVDQKSLLYSLRKDLITASNISWPSRDVVTDTSDIGCKVRMMKISETQITQREMLAGLMNGEIKKVQMQDVDGPNRLKQLKKNK